MRKAFWPSLFILILTMAGEVAGNRGDRCHPRPGRPHEAPAAGAHAHFAQQKRDLADVLAVQQARTQAQGERALSTANGGDFRFRRCPRSELHCGKASHGRGILAKVRGDGAVAFSAGKDVLEPAASLRSQQRGQTARGPSGRQTPIRAAARRKGISRRSCSPTWCRKRAPHCSRAAVNSATIACVARRAFSERRRGRRHRRHGAWRRPCMQDPAFLKDFAAAKSELRKALGL